MILKGALLFSAIILLSACSQDSCREYSDFTCAEIEKADYNVYFYFPGGNEQYLGQATGLSYCGSMAHSYAYEKELVGESWSYICCMIANDSSCYEKHR